MSIRASREPDRPCVTPLHRQAEITSHPGEFLFEIRTDPQDGVIDMFAGPTRDAMTMFPTRVVGLSDGRTAYSFTMFQGPGMPDELFDAQHASLQREFANIEKAFS